MKICKPHFERLCEAIKLRGLWHLVSASTEEGFRRVQAQFTEHVQPTDYDPVLAANMALVAEVVKQGGGELASDAHANTCPLCMVATSNGFALVGDWIDGVADDQLETARGLNIETPQKYAAALGLRRGAAAEHHPFIY